MTNNTNDSTNNNEKKKIKRYAHAKIFCDFNPEEIRIREIGYRNALIYKKIVDTLREIKNLAFPPDKKRENKKIQLALVESSTDKVLNHNNALNSNSLKFSYRTQSDSFHYSWRVQISREDFDILIEKFESTYLKIVQYHGHEPDFMSNYFMSGTKKIKVLKRVIK